MASSSDNNQGSGQTAGSRIRVAIHPKNQKAFKEIVMPKAALKAAKSNLSSLCYNCKRPGDKQELFRCARCMITLYCSKACQKSNWKAHKGECQAPTATTQKLSSFVGNLAANTVVQLNLATAFASELRMKEDFDPNRPIQGQCELFLKSSDAAFDLRLALGEITPSSVKEVECMVQLKNFTAEALDAWTSLEPTRAGLWRNMVETLTQKVPVAVLSFTMAGLPQSFSAGVVIHKPMVDMANNDPGFCYESALVPGLISHAPYSGASCLQSINLHIRDDKKNQLNLRTMLTMADYMKLRQEQMGSTEEGIPVTAFQGS